jgi:hypothetical protein
MASLLPVKEDNPMMRSRWLRWATCLSLLVLALPARAADDTAPLAQVPAGSAVVVYAQGLEHTKDRLLTMVKNAVPDLAATVQAQVENTLKQALKERSLKGLPKDGAVFVVIPQLPPTDEGGVIILQVTDYAAFRDGILTADERKGLKKSPEGYEETQIEGKPAFLLDRKGYAILTPSKEFMTQYTKPQRGLDTTLPRELAQKLVASDVGAYVDMAYINKQFGEQIKQGRQLFEVLIAQGQTGANKQQMEMLKRFSGPLFQCIEDSKAILLTLEFRPEGLAFHLQDAVAPDSKTNTILKGIKPASLGDVTKLPGGQMGYTAMRMDKALFKDLMPMLFGVGAGSENKEFEQAFQLLADADPHESLGTFQMPVQGLRVDEYGNPDKAAEGQLKLLQAVAAGGTYQSGVVKGKPTIKKDAQTYRGFKLSSAGMVWDFDKMLEQAQGVPEAMKEKMIAGMKKMMGNGLNIWFGSNGKVYVQVSAPDWESAKKLLDAYLDSTNTVGNQKAFQDVRKNLPAQASALILIDLPPFAQTIFSFVQEMLPAGTVPPNVPAPAAPQGKHSYLGVAVVLQEGSGSLDLFVPVSAVQDMRDMFGPLIKGITGQQ